MPPLKQLNCQVEVGTSNVPLQEYGTTYGDGFVETFVAVPLQPTTFSIHVTSDGYIAPGLAIFVFMDGVPQCNRNRQGLTHDTNIDFRVRQKEEKVDEGKWIAREWKFEQLNVVSADGQINISPDIRDNIGIIEVVVLRCTGENSYAVPKRKDTSAKVAGKTSQQNKDRNNGTILGGLGLMGLFDGANDDEAYAEWKADYERRLVQNNAVYENPALGTPHHQHAHVPPIYPNNFGPHNPSPYGHYPGNSQSIPYQSGYPYFGSEIAYARAHGHLPVHHEHVNNGIERIGGRYYGEDEVFQGPHQSPSPKSNRPQNLDWAGIIQRPSVLDDEEARREWAERNGYAESNKYNDENEKRMASGNAINNYNAWFEASQSQKQANNVNHGYDLASQKDGSQDDGKRWNDNTPQRDKRDHGRPRFSSRDNESNSGSSKYRRVPGLFDPAKPYTKPYFNSQKSTQFDPNAPASRNERIYVLPPEPLYSIPSEMAEYKMISHQVATGGAALYHHRAEKPDYIDTMGKPYAVFCFKYRSKDKLQEILDIEIKENEEHAKKRLDAMEKDELIQKLLKAKKAGYGPDSECSSSGDDEISRPTQDSKNWNDGGKPSRNGGKMGNKERVRSTGWDNSNNTRPAKTKRRKGRRPEEKQQDKSWNAEPAGPAGGW